MLWECPVYDTIRNTFMEDLDNHLGGSFKIINNIHVQVVALALLAQLLVVVELAHSLRIEKKSVTTVGFACNISICQ